MHVVVWSALARHRIRWCARSERLPDEALTSMVRTLVALSVSSAHVLVSAYDRRLPRVSCVSVELSCCVNVNERRWQLLRRENA